MLSPTCQYAIRALVHLAQHEAGRAVLARDIAVAEEIPRQFLSKILHQLGQKGLVRSQKGPGGGFMLARPASLLKLGDIIHAVEGDQDLSRRCILGLDECSDTASCALHDAWKAFRVQYESTIAALTLRDVAGMLERKHAQTGRIGLTIPVAVRPPDTG
jgi:Rrf2 family protein